jgi:integrase
MAKRSKLPPGLFRRRRKDGTESETIWCWWRQHGSRRVIQASTGTADVHEAKRFLCARLAEDPKAHAQRITTEAVTVTDTLALLQKHRDARGTAIHHALYEGLRRALGHLLVGDLRPAHLDDLCARLRAVGIEYPDRDLKRNPQHPVSGTTCNHGMRMLRQALRLAAVKLAVPLPPGLDDPLAYPKFSEPVTGQHIPPDVFYAILAHIDAGPKRALTELAYLLGVRKGQLRKTEIRNARVERGTVTALVWDSGKVKNRREHIVALVGRAQEIMQELWKGRRPGCPIFHLDGRPVGDLRSEWKRACTAAGFAVGRKAQGFVFHDTRRSATTNMSAAGTPDVVARTITGHRTASMHTRYNISQESAQREALAAVDRLVKAGRRA